MNLTGWRKRQIALDIKAENARELGLDYEPEKTIMEMARKAGMVYREFEDEFANANTDGVDLKTIEAFAALVRADEREACAYRAGIALLGADRGLANRVDQAIRRGQA